MYARRLTARVRESLDDTPVVFVQGPRQAGKSTLVQGLVDDGRIDRYLSLDSMAVRAAAESDPVGFVAGLEGSTAIDEVQRAPALALAIKAEVDRDRRPGRFLLTGSANVMVLPKLSESLAGRIEMHTLWPLSQSEISGRAAVPTLVDRLFEERSAAESIEAAPSGAVFEKIVQGGFPEALERRSPRRRDAWFDAYVTAILQRDVREIANIEKVAEMPRLLKLLASQVGSLVNYAALARALSLPQSTLKRYMALLEATFLIRYLPAWSSNLGKRIVKSPKMMLTDTGLLAHLLGLDAEGFLDNRTLAGHVLENFVMMELAKQRAGSERSYELFHYRATSGEEVDFVLEDRRGRLVAIEVKAAASLQPRDLKGLRGFAELVGDRFHRGAVLYLGDELVPFEKNLAALPLAALWAG